MRARLLEATIDSLYQVGYARTTTIEVAARAGVSRGAQLHHFPTKKRLVAMAVRHLLSKRLDEFSRAFSTLPEGADRYSAVIDIMWEKTQSRAFYAWLELIVAARTEPALRKTVVEIAHEFAEAVQRTFHQFFSSRRSHSSPFDVAPVFAFAVLQGLALDKIVWDDDDKRPNMVLMSLKALTSMTVRALEPAAAAAAARASTS